ncbi:MAG: helix-hairpin-helix domain-containing protein [Gammaproteobacteria bacterium]|nr:helix-hairpin-helix domain-containing protein [Gammaproteobacteria bacterium]
MKHAADNLQDIPGVGPSIARDLRELGIEQVAQLRGRRPQKLYEQLMSQRGCRIDRCMLYVLRCAVYYAEGGRDAERLRWWNWKDGKQAG